MKKELLCIVSMLILSAVPQTTFAANGDIAGHIYSTDIAAYIDGMAIPSYNIGGKTVIIAEDLEPYGFEVIWNEESRILNVNTKAKPRKTPDYTPQKAVISGNVVGDIYETDIEARVNGMWVESYNIGGRTALCMEDMASTDDEAKRMSRDGNPHRAIGYSVALMKAEWNPTARTISLDLIRPQSTIATPYGEAIVSDVKTTAYNNGSYAFYEEDETIISHWASNIHYNDDVYISMEDIEYGPFPVLSAKLNNGVFNISIPDESIRNILHTNSGTIGSCHNNVITLSDRLCVNGNYSSTETPDMLYYRGTLYVSENALNSAFGKKIFSDKYELPEECTEKIDVSRESHVVVYINDNHINSYNTLDGKCYISAKDLTEYGFEVTIKDYNCSITSPKSAINLNQETEYPETYWWGDTDPKYELYPIYNGVYDVTIDVKKIDDVFIHTSLIYRSPCIDAQDLAKTAGYRVDTSDPYKVKIYTE